MKSFSRLWSEGHKDENKNLKENQQRWERAVSKGRDSVLLVSRWREGLRATGPGQNTGRLTEPPERNVDFSQPCPRQISKGQNCRVINSYCALRRETSGGLLQQQHQLFTSEPAVIFTWFLAIYVFPFQCYLFIPFACLKKKKLLWPLYLY